MRNILLTMLFIAIMAGAFYALFGRKGNHVTDFHYVSVETRKDATAEFDQITEISTFPEEGSGLPKMAFSTRYEIRGMLEPLFEYSQNTFETPMEPRLSEGFLDRMEELQTLTLQDGSKPGEDKTAKGWVAVDGQRKEIACRIDSPHYADLRSRMHRFTERVTPSAMWQRQARHAQGDKVFADIVPLEDIISNPTKYDGKRVRVTGYYHFGPDWSSLALTPVEGMKKGPDGNYQGSVWLGKPSTFSDAAKVASLGQINDQLVIVEGSVDSHGTGKTGEWSCEIVRVTLCKPLKQ